MQSHGVMSRTELLALGVTSNEVQRRVRGGEWRRIRTGVYATTPTDGTNIWLQDFAGELCWGGEHAVLSHSTAAYLYGLDGFSRPRVGRPHIMVPADSACRGLNVHRTVLDHRTVSMFNLSVVAPDICLAQLGHVADVAEVELAVESALRHELVTLESLQEITTQAHTRIEGTRTLRTVLRRRPPDAPATRSQLETNVLQMLRHFGCAYPDRQVEMGAEVFAFTVPSRRLAISCVPRPEVTPAATRQVLKQQGWTVVDVALTELLNNQQAVVERLRDAVTKPSMLRPRRTASRAFTPTAA
jgi:very-short-patch-repair endonuclease